MRRHIIGLCLVVAVAAPASRTTAEDKAAAAPQQIAAVANPADDGVGKVNAGAESGVQAHAAVMRTYTWQPWRPSPRRYERYRYPEDRAATRYRERYGDPRLWYRSRPYRPGVPWSERYTWRNGSAYERRSRYGHRWVGGTPDYRDWR